jgi:predicted enzyme related to lactoylglutathione lyase
MAIPALLVILCARSPADHARTQIIPPSPTGLGPSDAPKSHASGEFCWIIAAMNLNQVTLPATNVERSAEFYRRLGFTQIVSALPRYARFECQNGATFSLHAFDTVLPAQTVVYFECDDLDATYGRLCKLGVEFNQAPKDQIWLWREAYLQDPDGNIICLYHAGNTRRFPPWRLSDDSPRL